VTGQVGHPRRRRGGRTGRRRPFGIPDRPSELGRPRPAPWSTLGAAPPGWPIGDVEPASASQVVHPAPNCAATGEAHARPFRMVVRDVESPSASRIGHGNSGARSPLRSTLGPPRRRWPIGDVEAPSASTSPPSLRPRSTSEVTSSAPAGQTGRGEAFGIPDRPSELGRPWPAPRSTLGAAPPGWPIGDVEAPSASTIVRPSGSPRAGGARAQSPALAGHALTGLGARSPAPAGQTGRGVAFGIPDRPSELRRPRPAPEHSRTGPARMGARLAPCSAVEPMTTPDALSELLLALRLAVERPRLHVLQPPWRVSIPGTWRGMHLVVAGRCSLRSPPRRQALAAGVGDTLLTCDGNAHVLASVPDSETVPVSLEALPEPSPVPGRQDPPGATLILSARWVFDARAPHPATRFLPLPLVVHQHHIPAPPGLSSTVQAILEELARPTQGSEFALRRLCEVLAAHALRAHQYELEYFERGWLRAFADPRLREALAQLRETPTLRASELARSSQSSSRNFRRAVAARTGDGPRSLLRHARLHLALELLEAGDASLSEVARQSGFHSVSGLCRAFRRETGTTPAATWRSLHRRPLPRRRAP
jgi:AraC-like DNA-binding protein